MVLQSIRRTYTGVVAVLAVLSLAFVPAGAQPSSPPTGTVVVGNIICFRIRVPDRQQTIQQRVDHIQEMAAKHLGGGPLRFTIRSVGARRHIDVNGEFLAAVTPEDAAATGHRTAATLVPFWRDALARGFRQSRARPAPPAVTEPKGSG
jgi:hypothetical protein